MTIRRSAAAVLVAAAVAAGPALTAPASAATADSSAVAQAAPTNKQLRDQTVARAQKALKNPRKFRVSAGGTVYRSTVLSGQGRNLLERSGSNANRNEFNHYNGLDWCGYFAAAMWTGRNVPNAASFPRIPDSYPSSQAWRWGVNNFKHFNGPNGAKPGRGDVLVWQNTDNANFGHVGVVVNWNAKTKKVTTIEGNVSGDEIRKHTYAWDGDGPTISGKKFTGFAPRV